MTTIPPFPLEYQYKELNAYSLEELERKTDLFISRGWERHGEIMSCQKPVMFDYRTQFTQFMKKKKDDSNEM